MVNVRARVPQPLVLSVRSRPCENALDDVGTSDVLPMFGGHFVESEQALLILLHRHGHALGVLVLE